MLRRTEHLPASLMSNDRESPDGSRRLHLSLRSNRQGFLVSCLRRQFSLFVDVPDVRGMFADVHRVLQSAAAGKTVRTASRTVRARAMARSASGRSMSSQFSGYRVSIEYRLSMSTWSSSMPNCRPAGICRARNRRSWVRGTHNACRVSNALRYFSAHCWA